MFAALKEVGRLAAVVSSCSVLCFTGCGDDDAPAGTGSVQVLLEAESTIVDGIAAGPGAEDITDGWSVSFSKYLIAVGHVELARSTMPEPHLHADVDYVVDLHTLPPAGFQLAQFEGVEAGRWDEFGYETPEASATSMRADNVSQADFDEMVAGGFTYLIEGTLTKSDGQSCPPGGSCRAAPSLSFRFGVSAPTAFGGCQAEEGARGLAVIADGTTAVSATIHGDHMFFTAFPTTVETLTRKAQWLANADTDGDNTVTRAELEALDPAALFPSAEYSLTGAPIPVVTSWDFIVAQLKAQGHFQGEGECELDGTTHAR